MVVAVDSFAVHAGPFRLADAFAIDVLAVGAAGELFTGLASKPGHALAHAVNAVTPAAAVLHTRRLLTIRSAEASVALTLAVGVTAVIRTAQ